MSFKRLSITRILRQQFLITPDCRSKRTARINCLYIEVTLGRRGPTEGLRAARGHFPSLSLQKPCAPLSPSDSPHIVDSAGQQCAGYFPRVVNRKICCSTGPRKCTSGSVSSYILCYLPLSSKTIFLPFSMNCCSCLNALGCSIGLRAY
jgi:hypothetical protein